MIGGKEYRDRFAANLNKLLERRGMRQRDLSLKTGIDPPHVSNWCQARGVPHAIYLHRLASALEVPIEVLVPPHDHDPPELLVPGQVLEVLENGRLRIVLRDAEGREPPGTLDLESFGGPQPPQVGPDR